MDPFVRRSLIDFLKDCKNKPIERLIPGREFHGTVVNSKCSKFEIGDHVVGLKHPTETFGTLSEYISSEGEFHFRKS